MALSPVRQSFSLFFEVSNRLLRQSGVTTVRGIAEELNRRGVHAPRGTAWHPTTVSRLLSRLKAAA